MAAAPGALRTAVPKTIASGRYEIGQRLGAGSFGDVYRGLDLQTRAPVAVKFEDGRTNQLQKELEVLRSLQALEEEGSQGFARILYFGQKGDRFCLVMECLGKSLAGRQAACGGRFSVQTTVLVAQQMLNCIELLHSKGVVHRDIKPDNFVCGVAEQRHHLYLIDFGLAEWYYGDAGHVPMKREDEFKGTMRYASVNSQRYFTQSRRDDLEAAGHTWLYFLNGTLPWAGLQGTSRQAVFQQVRDMKDSTPKSVLCAGQPRAFEEYLTYVSGLGYSERPDYARLRRLLSDLRASKPGSSIQDHEFEWEVGSHAGRLQPLRPPPACLQQPDDNRGAGQSQEAFSCPFCGAAAMRRSRHATDICQDGWTCGNPVGCGNGRSNLGAERFYCQACCRNYCTLCVERQVRFLQGAALPEDAPCGFAAPRKQRSSVGTLLGFLGCGHPKEHAAAAAATRH